MAVTWLDALAWFSFAIVLGGIALVALVRIGIIPRSRWTSTVGAVLVWLGAMQVVAALASGSPSYFLGGILLSALGTLLLFPRPEAAATARGARS